MISRIFHMTFCAILLFLLFPALVKSQQADDILGSWLTGEGRSHITIYEEGGKYFGKITWIKEPNDPDTKRPKTAKNGQPLMNLEILEDFVFEDGEWVDGTIYDPEAGKTYYCSMELDGEDKLKIRGSVDPMGWLGRTEVWT